MSEFWRQLEAEERTRRRYALVTRLRSLLGLGVIIVVLLWALWPELRRLEIATTKQPAPSNTAATGESQTPGSTSNDSYPRTQPSDSQDPNVPVTPDSTRPATTDDMPTPQSIVQSDLAPSKTKSQLRDEVSAAEQGYQEVFNGIGLPLLEQHGGTEWETTQRLVQAAKTSPHSQERIDAYGQATHILKESIPNIRLREAQAMLARNEYGKALEQLRRSNDDFPAHEPTRAAIQNAITWPLEAWISLAVAQAEAAAPDDPGFAEIWLGLSSAHELRGDTLAEREAFRRGWEAVERMTNVERAIESAIDLTDRQRLSADPLSLRRHISEVAKLCSQVAEPIKRAEYYADLAGLARLLDDESLYKELLQRSIDSASASRSSMRSYLPDIHRCRALSWFATPAEILEICSDVPKYNGRIGLDPFPANAMCYGYAAIAAARRADKQGFMRTMFLAETQLACINSNEAENPFARCVLAQADLVARNWRRAVISANNFADPELRASVLYSVLANSPQDVSNESVPPLLGKRGGMRYATTAVAAFVQHQLMTGHEPAELLAWGDELRHDSLRAAAYIGFARFVNLGTPEVPKQLDDTPATATDISGDFRTLMEQAERSAHLVQLPIDRAYCWILIARTWQRMEKPLSYRRACDEVRTACEQQWYSVWRQRPEPRAGIGDYYYANHPHYYFDSGNRDREAEMETVSNICDCLVFLAERQAENGDANGAMETCLDAARVSQFCSNNVAKLFYFLRMQAVAAQAEDTSKISHHTLELELEMFPMFASYRRCLISAWSHDLPQLQRHAAEFEKDPPRSNRASITARVYAELAVLAAKHKKLELYRTTRRATASLIDRQDAMPELGLMLAEADALAGEFALSENGLTKQTMMWYGTADRPRSTLVIKLAEAGRVDDATNHYSRLSQPYWKLRSIQAIAKAKAASKSDEPDVLAAWIKQLDDPLDRVGADCGLALAARSQPR